MRSFFAICLVFLSFAPAQTQAQAQTTRVDFVQVVGVGIMKPESKLEAKANSDISTGKRLEIDKIKIVDQTTTIPAKSGTIFGADIKLVGKPNGKDAKITIIWRYPEPGLKNPQTGTIKTTDQYDIVYKTGNVQALFWSLQNEWVLVPGTWTLEVWQDDRRLMTQDFKLVK